jgi:hypothetical protein
MERVRLTAFGRSSKLLPRKGRKEKPVASLEGGHDLCRFITKLVVEVLNWLIDG